MFSMIKEGDNVKKVRLFVLDFEIKWDGTACLRPAHTKMFAFYTNVFVIPYYIVPWFLCRKLEN